MFNSLFKHGLNTLKYFCVAFTICSLTVMFTPVSQQLAKYLEIEPVYKKSDVIIVLSGGAYSDGALTTSSNERILQGINLFKMGYAPKLIVVGSTINSVTRKIADAFTESSDDSRIDIVDSLVMKNIAINLGVHEKDIIIDTSSTHTYDNIKKALYLMRKNNLITGLIVSSDTHMFRVMKVAKKLGINILPAHTANYSAFRVGAMDRMCLFYETVWEFMGLGIYSVKGWI